MPKAFVFSMFYLSFAPLWICTAFIDFMSLYDGTDSPWTEIIGLSLIGLGFLFSIIVTAKTLKHEGGENYKTYNVVDAKEDMVSATTYLLSNTLPLFAFDFTKWQSSATFLIIFIVLLWLCVVHNRYDCNVCLELVGFRLYKCWLNREGETKDDIVVLIRHTALHNNDEISIRPIGGDLYLGYLSTMTM